jgi:hypothetical protein
MSNNPILVTGSHRSGSTWVGRMIAASQKVVYIHEPFNTNQYKPGIFHIEFEHPFTYITEKNEGKYYKPLKKTISLKYDLVSGILSQKFSFSAIKQEFGEYKKYNRLRNEDKRVLIKDPLAVMSTEWLAERFNMQTIVLIRHPAAFIASIQLKNWGFYFNHFLAQEQLMEDHLQEFEDKIVQYHRNRPSIIDQGILLWRIIYSVVYKYTQNHGDWKFIRHEDLSRKPIHEFYKLYDFLGLDFTDRVRKIIRSHSKAKNVSSGIKRDSKDNIYTWKERLSKSEIKHIHENVEDVSHHFYTSEDW